MANIGTCKHPCLANAQADPLCCQCRGTHLPLDLLSKLLQTHSVAELLDNLQRLIDYLLLPGTLSSYLPPKSKITLRHIGVLDLHCHMRYAAAVRTAVDCIMSRSMGRTSTKGPFESVSKGAAYFFIQRKTSSHSVDVAMYGQ